MNSVEGLRLINKHGSNAENTLSLLRSSTTSSTEMYNHFDGVTTNFIDFTAYSDRSFFDIGNCFNNGEKSKIHAYADSKENYCQMCSYDWETPSLMRALIRTRSTSNDNGDYGVIDLRVFGNNNSTIKAQVSLFNTGGGDGNVRIEGTDTVSIIGKNKIQFGTNSNYNYISSDNICYWFNGVDYGKSIVTYAASGWGVHSIAFGCHFVQQALLQLPLPDRHGRGPAFETAFPVQDQATESEERRTGRQLAEDIQVPAALPGVLLHDGSQRAFLQESRPLLCGGDRLQG